MKRHPTYRDIDREEVPPGNPIDIAVHRRVGRPRLQRRLVNAAQAVVEGLGKRRRLWFVYEVALGRMTSLQQAAYFDLGIQHGIAAARADALRARPVVKKLADRIVREALGADVDPADRVAAAVIAAWAVMGSGASTRPGE